MKARVAKMPPKKAVPTALLYNLENARSYDIGEMCRDLGIRAVHLDTTSAAYSVGNLCGIDGYSDEIIPCEIPQSEAVVLYSVDDDKRTALLDKMRQTNNTVDLKCIVTDTNKAWALGALVAELEKEHAAMHGKA